MGLGNGGESGVGMRGEWHRGFAKLSWQLGMTSCVAAIENSVAVNLDLTHGNVASRMRLH